ncbi:hypothetical protein MANES_15G097301v8 [Manihot esculenta]|uniref:Uncharacterized protein n=1 Tax=Manihot esculenta TaxID=3983 RepID=A0ACB7GAY0_MANES|nr:hypothetical protein MANES_15G097301v8 [Manihot esculenta]
MVQNSLTALSWINLVLTFFTMPQLDSQMFWRWVTLIFEVWTSNNQRIFDKRDDSVTSINTVNCSMKRAISHKILD